MISFATSLLLAAAADSTPPGPVVARVAESVGAAWGVPAERVRLAWGLLPPTPIPADAVTRLRGTGANGWYVVVFTAGSRVAAVRVQAGTEDSVTVAAAMLPSGHQLLPTDLRRELRVRFGAPEAGTPIPEAGWVARRPIAEGTVLLPPMVAPPALVRAGAPVRFIWRQGGVEVEIEATALQDGALGEMIRARGPAHEALLGRVTGTGVATIERGAK